MSSATNIYSVLQDHGSKNASRDALLAPDGTRISFRSLWQEIEQLSSQLQELGIRRQDPVAIVLPNSPDMVIAFLAVAAVGIAAPLNPRYRTREFDFYLADTGAKALLVPAGAESPARQAARERDLPIIELRRTSAGAPLLSGYGLPPAAAPAPIRTGDIALLLHTSGSTSRPKLAPLTHNNLRHGAESAVRALQLTAADRCLNVMPLFHIHGLMAGALAPLVAGGSVVCPPDFTAPQFFEWLAEFAPTWYTAVPAMHQSILARAEYEAVSPRPLRFIRSSSSPLPPAVMADLEQLFDAPVVEVYGMTEACSQVAANPLPPDRRKAGSVGLPAGPEVAIMAIDDGALLPTGTNGEIVMRGVSVMGGYLRNPEANARSFAGDWFRTGDLGHLDEDGYLFIDGRLKDIIDRSGEKISPLQIDEVLLDHPAVAEAATFGLPHPVLGEEIAAAVVLHSPGVTESELRHFVALRLADFKTPRRIVFVDAIPRNATGKVQRRNLAEQLGLGTSFVAPAREEKPVPPATEMEKAVAQLWQEVLHAPQVAANERFLDLGGNSILAAQLVARMQQQFRVSVSLIDFFDAPTVALQAAILEAAPASAEDDLLLDASLPSAPDSAAPASFSQEHLWFLKQLNPDSTVYNVAKAYRLRGPLNLAALEYALDEVVRRHASLRTTLRRQDGRLVQIIEEERQTRLEFVDLGHLPEAEREPTAYRLAAEDAETPFDLARGPLLRATILRLDETDHVFFFNMHHVITDGWSLNLFRGELSLLYAAYCREAPASLPELPVQYADYALWQRQKLRDAVLQEHVNFWKERLNQFPHVLDLPTDRPRPPVQTFSGATHDYSLAKSISDAMDALCRATNVTRFMVLSAALNIVLHHYTGQDKILLGAASANRVQPYLENVIGFFINTVVLPTDLTGNPSARELLGRVRQASFEIFEHQDLPFSQIVEAAQPERDLSRAPLFQVMVVMINYKRNEWTLANVDVELMKTGVTASKFDLTLYTFQEEGDESLQVRFEYNTDLFDEATISRLWNHLETTLARMIADPTQRVGQLSPLSNEERRQLLVTWNDTRTDFSLDATLVALFEAQAARRPVAPALLWQQQKISYEQLNRRANRLAHLLKKRGVAPGAFVGLFVERSPEMVVGVLAILKAGGAFLPLDPAYPARRLAYMVEDAEPAVILTTEQYRQQTPAGMDIIYLDSDATEIGRESDTNPSPVTAEITYLIYTSGSTGQPKGVLGRQQGIINRLTWMWETFPFGEDEVACLKTSPNFVDSVAELFGPLLQGAPSLILPDEQVKDPAQLVQALAQHSITRLVLVPSLLAALLDDDMDLARRLPRLRLCVSSGESLSPRLCRRFHQKMPHCRLLNFYGMSEVAADVTYFDTAQLHGTDQTVPIGRPIANTIVYILDANLNPAPIGVTGELYAGGAGLARGYHRRPQLTAERFVPNPFAADITNDSRARPPGFERLYRTGDLARYRADGAIEYMGRSDHQVKVRGHRIELGEIEAALLAHRQVHEAVVIARGEDRDRRLVAFVTVRAGIKPNGLQLRRFLQKRLPPYMAPATVTILDSLPLAPGGKIDRRALAARKESEQATDTPFTKPRTALEAQMADLWAGVLGRPRVGLHDNFFDMGGHSLLALRLMARIKEQLGLHLPLMALFRAPTVAELAAVAESDEGAATWSPIEALQPDGQRTPFFCVHGVTGDVLWFAELASRLAPQQPFYGLQARGLDGEQAPFQRIEAMAAYYLHAIRRIQPHGPYLLGGASFGGMVAYEMAQQLQADGEQVARLVMFDYAPGAARPTSLWRPGTALRFARNLPHWLADMRTLPRAQVVARFRRQLRNGLTALRRPGKENREQREVDARDLLDYGAQLPQARRRLVETHVQALRRYKPQPYAGRISFIRARSRPLLRPDDPESGWQDLAQQGVAVIVVPGSHEGMFRPPHVATLAHELAELLKIQ